MIYRPNAAAAIFFGGLAWGLLMNVPPIRILQSVASGALGRASYQMGWRSALAGLGFHFLIAFGAASVYWIASRGVRFMIDHALWAAVIFGECVYLFMNFVVAPLSAIHRFPTYSLPHILTGPIGHTILVGPPIALIARHFSRPIASVVTR